MSSTDIRSSMRVARVSRALMWTVLVVFATGLLGMPTVLPADALWRHDPFRCASGEPFFCTRCRQE